MNNFSLSKIQCKKLRAEMYVVECVLVEINSAMRILFSFFTKNTNENNRHIIITRWSEHIIFKLQIFLISNDNFSTHLLLQ